MGVVAAPDRTAANGPDLRDAVRPRTETLVLRGLLRRQTGASHPADGDVCGDPPPHATTHCVYPSVSHAACVCRSVQLSLHTLLHPEPRL